MFTDQLAAVIEISPVRDLDGLAKLLWKGHGAGTISDDDAQRLAEAIQRRRDIRPANPVRTLQPLSRPALTFLKPKPQRSPDKARSIARRRSLAASGPLPPALAANFTTGELAVLRIIGDEVGDKGLCDRSIAELAARAGVGMSTVRNAVRFAGRCGLLTVQERPRPGRKNLTNIVRIISREWLTWMAIGARRVAGGEVRGSKPRIGFKKTESTGTDIPAIKEKGGVWRPRGIPREQRNRGRTAC
jgi:hypothetical protein